jgi:translocation and assembly module TamB
VKKRKAALAFLLVATVPVVTSLLVLRTEWAGTKLCRIASERLADATGLTASFGACRVDPLLLAVEVDGVALSRGGAPVFSADGLRARFAPVQAFGRTLHLSELRLVRPRVDLALEGGGDAGTCPPPALQRFAVRRLEVQDGAIELGLPGGRHLSVAGLGVSSRDAESALGALAPRRARVAVEAGPVRLTGPGGLSSPRLAADLDLALDLSRLGVDRAEAEVDGVALALAGHVEDLCHPRLDLAVRAEAPVGGFIALLGFHPETEGTATIEARVTGAPPAVEATGTLRTRGARIDGFALLDSEAQVRVKDGTVLVERGVVAAEGGVALVKGKLELARGLPVEADIEATGVDLAEVLERLKVPGAWLTVKLDGKGHASGTLAPANVDATFDGDLSAFKALTRSWREGGADPGVLAFEKGGRGSFSMHVDEEAITFERARASLGRGTLDCEARAHYDVRAGFRSRCQGSMDLTALGRLADVPWAGLLQLDGTAGAAPYGNPRIQGRARAEGFRFLDIDLGSVSTDFLYDAFLLRLTGAEGVRAQSRYQGEGVIDLSKYPSQVLSSRLEAKGRLRDFFDAVTDWLPRARYVRDVMDGEVELVGTAHGRADALDCEFDGRLGAGTVWGRRYDSGRMTGAILKGEAVRYDRAELRRGTGVARATGTWGSLPPFAWDLEASFAGVPLAELDLPGRWEGSASGTARLEGSYERPRIRFAASGDAVAVNGMRLGTIQAGGNMAGAHLVTTGSAEGVDLAAEVELQGAFPFQARAELDLPAAEKLLPAGPAGLKARVKGRATATGALSDLARARAALRLDAVQAALADVKLEAAAPVELAVDAGKVTLAPVTLSGPSTQLVLSGGGTTAGALDVSASGTVDLALLTGFLTALRRPHGQLALEAHVGGTVAEPALVGSGRLSDGGFQVRGATAALTGLRGPLAFSQNRILFDGLAADLNGGPVKLNGEVELQRLAPSRFGITAELGDVPLAVPPELPVTLRGVLVAEGTPSEALLTGRLHVVRGRYTADVDLEGSLLAVRRRPPPPPRAYDKAGEWLRFDVAMAVDGDVRVDNDLVRGPLFGELNLTGNLASPGLVGTLAMGQGSRLAFRGNEFNLTQAVLEFTDPHKVEVALDVHGQSQVRDYDVTMAVTGSLASPQVTLTSVPTLPQPDIVTLLSLGYTRRDSGAGTGVSGVATAAAAQALFSASGLDDQVRRFLPRGGPVGDLNMRITSGYSEETGQVEPRAEFESWLWRDRLRLRIQAPLSGTRGKNAQAELRLGEHTAVQYQWDADNPDVSTGDHGLDLKLRWEWNDR